MAGAGVKGLPEMNWTQAVAAMKTGKRVQRASQQRRTLLSANDGTPVFECGTEPCLLAHAWTDDEKPVLVFRGAESGVLFVPDSEDRGATDWVCV